MKPASKRKPGIPADVRRAVMKRARDACERCQLWGRKADPHHRLPTGRLGKHTVENIVALCRECHDHVHANPEESIAAGWTISTSPKDV